MKSKLVILSGIWNFGLAALFYGFGWQALFGGVTVTLWGIALVTTVPRLSGRTFTDLVLDRQTT